MPFRDVTKDRVTPLPEPHYHAHRFFSAVGFGTLFADQPMLAVSSAECAHHPLLLPPVEDVADDRTCIAPCRTGTCAGRQL